MVHICQGNYAVGPDYDGQIGHRYFDQGRYKADLVCKIECDGYPDRARHDASLRRLPWRQATRRRRGRRAGAERGDRRTGRERIKAHRWLAPEQTIITSSCGFNHLPRHIALGKLRAMTEAKAILSSVGRVMTQHRKQSRWRRARPAPSDERLRLAEAASGIGAFEMDLASRRMGVEPAGCGAVRARPRHSAARFRGMAASDFRRRCSQDPRGAGGCEGERHILRRIPGQARGWQAALARRQGAGRRAATVRPVLRGTFYDINERKQLEARLLARQ